jgi:hypothetical protein
MYDRKFRREKNYKWGKREQHKAQFPCPPPHPNANTNMFEIASNNHTFTKYLFHKTVY